MSSAADRNNVASPDNPSILLDRYRRQLRRERIKVWAIQIGAFVFSIALWELVVRYELVREILVGQPSRIVGIIEKMVQDGSLFRHSWITIFETLSGFVLGVLGGAACGLLLWWSRTAERVLDPIMVILNSLPKIALTPIFLLWFGVGITMKFALCFSTVFVVVFLTAAAGIKETDQELLQLTAALGGTRWQIFRNVVVPSSVPWLISAMKLGIGFGLTGAVVGEFVAANQGIGYLLLYGAQIYDMSLVWAGIVVLIIVAIAMYACVVLIERMTLAWRD